MLSKQYKLFLCLNSKAVIQLDEMTYILFCLNNNNNNTSYIAHLSITMIRALKIKIYR